MFVYSHTLFFKYTKVPKRIFIVGLQSWDHSHVSTNINAIEHTFARTPVTSVLSLVAVLSTYM